MLGKNYKLEHLFLSAGNRPDNLSGSSRGKSIRVTPTNFDSNVKPRIRVPLPTGMLTDMEHRQIGWGEGCERVTAYIRLGREGEGGSGGGGGGGIVDGLDKVAHVEPLWAPVNHGGDAASDAVAAHIMF